MAYDRLILGEPTFYRRGSIPLRPLIITQPQALRLNSTDGEEGMYLSAK